MNACSWAWRYLSAMTPRPLFLSPLTPPSLQPTILLSVVALENGTCGWGRVSSNLSWPSKQQPLWENVLLVHQTLLHPYLHVTFSLPLFRWPLTLCHDPRVNRSTFQSLTYLEIQPLIKIGTVITLTLSRMGEFITWVKRLYLTHDIVLCTVYCAGHSA